jgi:Adenine specific DNA methylase Mod
MEKITADSQEAKSTDIVAENIARLKELFPEAFAEDGIDFEALKQLLGGAANDKEEKYSFTWPGKRQARQIALTPSLGTLRPAPEESVDWNSTKNIFIEGDNLEVLKLLQKSYSGKVKMIYIDPPYNTGKDFIYPDNLSDTIYNYKKITGQIDQDGFALISNPEISGRFHSNWLSMIYPRLRLARNLLQDDGVIFISIDDCEVDNLCKVCDEIFGEENRLGLISVVSNLKGRSDDKYYATAHNYILAYSKYSFKTFGISIPGEYFSEYTEIDGEGNRYRLLGLRKRGDSARRVDRPNMFYPFYANPDNFAISLDKGDSYSIEILPYLSDGEEGRWRWGKDTARERMNELVCSEVGRERRLDIFQIDYAEGSNGSKRIKPKTIWSGPGFANETGSLEVKSLLGKRYFDTPKPVGLIKYCLEHATQDDDLILDFFAGSSTTAHAVFDINKDDSFRRRFILVQLPEPTDIPIYPTIADIGKDRIRRVAEKMKLEYPDYAGDLGFRVFKLDSSNIRLWNPDADDVAGSLMAYTDNLLPNRTEQDLLYEVLLKFGLDLTSPMQETSFSGHTVYSMGQGVLFACLSKTIAPTDVEPIGLGIANWRKETNPVGESTVIFRDNAFAGDVAKANMTAILQQHGIDNVRSL